ncbi:hypothetical protein DXG01_005960 [Tephrocybe rancida]|nr:hypothetical protein DXG01_005960 [Tephrocybe rancida]
MLTTTFLLSVLSFSTFATPLEPGQSCAAVTVYFARGTTELGTLGTFVGPPFKIALESALAGRTLEFVGINYPAAIGGYLAGGDQGGATTMANLVTAKASSCPSTKIVISGYSQGAQVTHLAAGKLFSSAQSRVNAAVVFGDPDNGQAFPGTINSHVKSFCASGDLICHGQSVVLPPHLSYGANVAEAARFVVSQI